VWVPGGLWPGCGQTRRRCADGRRQKLVEMTRIAATCLTCDRHPKALQHRCSQLSLSVIFTRQRRARTPTDREDINAVLPVAGV
jgi:hypothetical protein